MTSTLLPKAMAGLLVLGASFVAQTAEATTPYQVPPVIVGRTSPLLRFRECANCYKGYDFGQDCFQKVWTGFEEVVANVCLWGWK